MEIKVLKEPKIGPVWIQQIQNIRCLKAKVKSVQWMKWLLSTASKENLLALIFLKLKGK